MTMKLSHGPIMEFRGRSIPYAPVLKITDPEATILGSVSLKNGKTAPAFAKKTNADGSTTYLCSTPFVSASVLRKIAKEIGVHIYCDSDEGVVFANNSMIAFHTGTPGEYTLKAKAPVKWTMVFPEKRDYPEKQAELTFKASFTVRE